MADSCARRTFAKVISLAGEHGNVVLVDRNVALTVFYEQHRL
jgi:hypothetical protein